MFYVFFYILLYKEDRTQNYDQGRTLHKERYIEWKP